MKKFLVLILVLTLSITAVACTQGNDQAADGEETWQDLLGNEGVLRVGISPDYPPYESYDADGNIVGFDVELVKFMADYLDVEYELVPMEFQTIISSMNAGTVDVGVSCFSYSPDRDVLFSDTYYTSRQVAIVAADSGITELDQLANKTIAGGTDTTAYDAAVAFAEEHENITVQSGVNDVMFQSMRAGALQAVIIDDIVGQNWVDNSDGDFVMLEASLADEETKVIVKNGNELLLDAVNEAVRAYLESDVYQENVQTFFGAEQADN